MIMIPRRGHTRQGKECLIYQSVRDPNVGYEFLRRTRGGDVRRTANGDTAYVCGGCMCAQKRLRDERAPNIPSVRQIGFGDDGRFTSDPDEHHHFCDPISWMELERRQLYRKVVENVRGKDFSSSQAVEMLNQAIEEKRINPAEHQQFNRSMPSTRSLKRMLRRATAPANYPADFGMENIPQELQNSQFEMPLPIIPPIRPQLQNQNQHFVNPNLFRNPFIEAQQQQNFMNQQMQMLMLQQQQQQMAHFQWQQMMMQNRFRFP